MSPIHKYWELETHHTILVDGMTLWGQAYLLLIWEDLKVLAPSLLALVHSFTENFLPSRPWTQHSFDTPSLQYKTSTFTFPAHGPACTWRSVNSQSLGQALSSLCLCPALCFSSSFHPPLGAWWADSFAFITYYEISFIYLFTLFSVCLLH